MMRMMAIESAMTVGVEELEDASSKTMKIGGFFKANWECTVIWKKEGTLKISKTVDCEAKAIQGMGPEPNKPVEFSEAEF
jgi:hypothetical protein